jgi:DNA-binding GntR family transcriptional regulator
MANLFEVSLQPVRVAVQKLETGGFLAIGKNRRITVNQLNRSDLAEIMEVRLLN